jgi:hypothetical protein
MSFRLLLIGLALTCSQQAFATTFISGGVAVGTNATLGALTDPYSESVTLGSIVGVGIFNRTADSLVGIRPGSETFAVGAIVDTAATWNSVDSGTFSINWGWDVYAPNLSAKAESNQVPANWFYTFVASGNGLFSVSGNVVGTGNTFGLQPIYFGDDGGGSIGGDVFDPTGSGVLVFALLSGQTYTFSASNNGNISGPLGLIASGSATSDFAWNIEYNNVSAIPVPAAFPLLASGLVGLGAIGARRRSKRKLAA